MKKLFLSFFLFWTLFVHAGYNYHWAAEQKYTTRSSINQIEYFNALIAKLKADGNWVELDVFWMMAVENQQQAVWNLKNPGSNTLTEVNSPEWIAKQGYKSNGTTSYLNTNFNPATQGVKFVRNSASMHIYSKTDIAETKYDMGSHNTTNFVRTHIIIRSASNTMFGNINTIGTTTQPVTDSRGFFSTQRTSSAVTTYYRNGVSLGTTADVSAAVESLNGFICARNASGFPLSWTNKQYSMAAYGSGSVDHANFKNAVETYMDAIGGGVIP